jgi:repressor LexA
MALTRRQREVLDVIRNFLHRCGYSPSLEEIGAELGLSSVATVHKHVSLLADKGYVRRAWNQNRSIELTDLDPAASSRLPLRGVLTANRPITPADAADMIAVPADMVSSPNVGYVLRVSGDAMEDDRIRDGDLLVVEAREPVRDGETVLAELDGGAPRLKRWFREGNRVRLLPACDASHPIVAPVERVQVHGVAVGVIRRYS